MEIVRSSWFWVGLLTVFFVANSLAGAM